MNAPARPRPHQRAVRQLLLGLVPLLLIGAGVLAVLAVRLSAAEAPLDAATATAQATVVASGRPPAGRGIAVTIDAGGQTRTGLLVLPQQVTVPPGAELTVQYDPDSPVDATAVHLAGDAAHRDLENILFGIAVVGAVLVATAVLTLWRLLSRLRLRRAPTAEVTATRVIVRQGLLVRSWLELVTAHGIRWLPVYWSPELARLVPGSLLRVHGDPGRRSLVMPGLDGAELWPSGRLRRRPPRGDRSEADPEPEPAGTGWGRQVRGDAVALVFAPVLGLLWAFVDTSGVAGFVVATVVAAGVLFWLPQLLGSDPAPPDR